MYCILADLVLIQTLWNATIQARPTLGSEWARVQDQERSGQRVHRGLCGQSWGGGAIPSSWARVILHLASWPSRPMFYLAPGGDHPVQRAVPSVPGDPDRGCGREQEARQHHHSRLHRHRCLCHCCGHHLHRLPQGGIFSFTAPKKIYSSPSRATRRTAPWRTRSPSTRCRCRWTVSTWRGWVHLPTLELRWRVLPLLDSLLLDRRTGTTCLFTGGVFLTLEKDTYIVVLPSQKTDRSVNRARMYHMDPRQGEYLIAF